MTRSIVWFRRDLRLTDNPCLRQAAEDSEALLPLFVVTDESRGEASCWWLHHSLLSLAEDLQAMGSELICLRGDPEQCIAELAAEHDVQRVYWGDDHSPAGREQSERLQSKLQNIGIEVKRCNTTLLNRPDAIENQSGDPYRVFTPYWKRVLQNGIERDISEKPESLPSPWKVDNAVEIEALDLLPDHPWHEKLSPHWQPGESTVLERLREYVEQSIDGYAQDRDRPDIEGTSKLSPHLAFGEIGPAQIVAAVQGAQMPENDRERFLAEIGWREFAWYLLYHFPETVSEPLNQKFRQFPWRNDYAEDLRRWQKGTTGIPLVDAGMRQLWETGWMHNRVRMIVASFLIKNLGIHWREGADWFADTLVDHDIASNTMGWQWCAGSGADAAPYFRIFNPVTQAEKYDPQGEYIARWIPELADLSGDTRHQPWSDDGDLFTDPEGSTYPPPMVDLKESRQRALDDYQAMKDRVESE